ncbi:MAG: hypothetical protein HQM15_06745 [Deltaproteobacteria bacterium]|nr:hypothetical protein [Deltaproteobacteria bacterium]
MPQQDIKEEFFQISISLFFSIYILHKIIQRIDLCQKQSIPFDFFNWANWILVIFTFVIFAFIYAFRGPAISKAKGFKEVCFPPLLIFIPILVYESIHYISLYPSLLKPLIFLRTDSLLFIFANGVILLGNALNIYSLLHLRKSFSILVQARNVVQSGPYRGIRHPLYLGEFLATIGFMMTAPSIFNLLFTFLFIFLQNIRAKIEEQKLVKTFPEYEDYLKRTNRYFPIKQAFKWGSF